MVRLMVRNDLPVFSCNSRWVESRVLCEEAEQSQFF